MSYVDMPTIERRGETVCRSCGRSMSEKHGPGSGAFVDGKIRCIIPPLKGHDPGPGFVGVIVDKNTATKGDLLNEVLVVREIDVPEELQPYLGTRWYETPNGRRLTIFDVPIDLRERAKIARRDLERGHA